MYHILQKIGDEYFCIRYRKPIASFDQALEKIKALRVLDEDNMTYIITQKVGSDE
jgi:virulence-associated protein VapD